MTTPGPRRLTWESTRHRRRLQPASGADPAAGAGRAGSPQTCSSSLASSQPTGAVLWQRRGAQRCPPRAPGGLRPAGMAGAGGRGAGRARAPFSGHKHRGPSAGAGPGLRGQGARSEPRARPGTGTGSALAGPRLPPAPARPAPHKHPGGGRGPGGGSGSGWDSAAGPVTPTEPSPSPTPSDSRKFRHCPGRSARLWVPPPPSAHPGPARRPHGRVRGLPAPPQRRPGAAAGGRQLPPPPPPIVCAALPRSAPSALPLRAGPAPR